MALPAPPMIVKGGDGWPYLADTGRLWIGGNLTTLLSSDDLGMTWTTHDPGPGGPPGGDSFRVWAKGMDVYVAGYQGYVSHSGDGGKTWTPQQTAAQGALYGIWGASGKDVYVVGQYGTILHTTDGAAHWNVEMSSGLDGYFFSGVCGMPNGDVIAVGNINSPPPNTGVIAVRH
jgi:photosystem II stability/assembly factor-like uncharacterized protein